MKLKKVVCYYVDYDPYFNSIITYTFDVFSSLTAVFVVVWFDNSNLSWCNISVGISVGVFIDDGTTIKKFKMIFDAQIMFKLKIKIII